MLKNTALLIISIVFTFLLGEAFCRLLGYRGEIGWNLQNVVRVDDNVLNYRLKANSVTFTGNVVYRLNSKGFRDSERQYEKPHNVQRIVVLGDSVAFGYKINFAETFSRVLERRLQENSSGKVVEVVTLAMPGLNTIQESRLLSCEGAKFNPNMIIVAFSINDADVGVSYKVSNMGCRIEMLKMPIPCFLKDSMKKSALLLFLKSRLDALLWKMDIQDYDDVSSSISTDYFARLYREESKWTQHVSAGLRDIANFSQKMRIPAVLVIFPIMFHFNEYRWGWIHEKVVKEAEANHFYVIDLLPEYRKYPIKQIRIERGDFVHPGRVGHSLAATVVSRNLIEQDTLSKGRLQIPSDSVQRPSVGDCPRSVS